MRVLVLLPTTGGLNQVVRIEARPDLPASGVYAQHDFRPLAITPDYDALTAKSGPLAALAAPVKAGAHRLWLEAPIEAGKSWELPVLLAHLTVALGAELAAGPSSADLVLWSTGAVDLDLRIVGHDYRLAAKARHSAAVLAEAAAHGARIIALVPAGEDDAPVCEVMAGRGRVETVDGVARARAILEETLRRDVVPAKPRSRRRIAALAGTVVAAAVAAGLCGLAVHAALPWTTRLAASALAALSGNPDAPPQSGRARDDGARDDGARDDGARDDGAKDDGAKHDAKDGGGGPGAGEPAVADGGHAGPPPEPGPGGDTAAAVSGTPDGAAPAATVVAAPLRLVEIRDPHDLMCVAVLKGERAPRLTDVEIEVPGRFHDSAGTNLCGLEWKLTPEAAHAGITGFDIDLAAERLGARVIRTPAAGASGYTRITVQFERDFGDPGKNPGRATSYRAHLKFMAAPPPGQVQVFQHALR